MSEPTTFEEWLEAWTETWADGLDYNTSDMHAAYAAGVASQQAALRIAEYDRDVIAPANAADTDAILEANNRLQAQLADARAEITATRGVAELMKEENDRLTALVEQLRFNMAAYRRLAGIPDESSALEEKPADE